MNRVLQACQWCAHQTKRVLHWCWSNKIIVIPLTLAIFTGIFFFSSFPEEDTYEEAVEVVAATEQARLNQLREIEGPLSEYRIVDFNGAQTDTIIPIKNIPFVEGGFGHLITSGKYKPEDDYLEPGKVHKYPKPFGYNVRYRIHRGKVEQLSVNGETTLKLKVVEGTNPLIQIRYYKP